jgi:ribosome-binding protein aMBF1 (putative translation factor)
LCANVKVILFWDNPASGLLSCPLFMRKTIHSPASQTFCSLFREERQKARLSQERLAEKLNRPQSFVAKIEKGERRVDLVEFLTIASAMGIDPVKFMRKLQRALESQT